MQYHLADVLRHIDTAIKVAERDVAALRQWREVLEDEAERAGSEVEYLADKAFMRKFMTDIEHHDFRRTRDAVWRTHLMAWDVHDEAVVALAESEDEPEDEPEEREYRVTIQPLNEEYVYTVLAENENQARLKALDLAVEDGMAEVARYSARAKVEVLS